MENSGNRKNSKTKNKTKQKIRFLWLPFLPPDFSNHGTSKLYMIHGIWRGVRTAYCVQKNLISSSNLLGHSSFLTRDRGRGHVQCHIESFAVIAST